LGKRVQKKNDITGLLISLFLAPVAGLIISAVMLAHATGTMDRSTESLIEFCASPQATHAWGCDGFYQGLLLRKLSLVALGLTLLLPLGYSIAVSLLARNRAALARGFPIVVRVCLLTLPLIIVAHAVLAAFCVFELWFLALMPRNSLLLIGVCAVIGAMLLSAFNILTGMRSMLAIEPLRATGIVVDEQRLPALHARVRAIARKLGAVAPGKIVVGIEPTPFMTSLPVRLRGSCDLPDGETLYVSTLVIQMLDEGELDAILAREIAHFHGVDLVFSRKFAPAHAGLVNALESVDDDASENPAIRMSKLPAFGLLSFMLWVLKGRLARANFEREELADRVALAMATAPRLMSGEAKLTALGVQWPAFRAGLNELMNRGVGRRNIARDYLARTRTFLANTDQRELQANLSKMATPHPADGHLSLNAHGYVLQLDEKPVIVAAVIALRAERPVDPVLREIEEEVTAADLDYTRVPGHPIEILASEELPSELAY
jgi:hypothetical protein